MLALSHLQFEMKMIWMNHTHAHKIRRFTNTTLNNQVISISIRRWTLLGYPGLGLLESLLARQPLKGQWKNHDVLKKQESSISALP